MTKGGSLQMERNVGCELGNGRMKASDDIGNKVEIPTLLALRS